ncbi:MAG: hypothetical protein WBD20_16250 [Pirellulaceae bacterium]
MDKIKDFFIYHVEKIILALVVAISGFLIFSGLGKEHITAQYQPDAIAQQAQQVKSSVDDDHSDAILKDRKSDFDIPHAITIRANPVDKTGYDLPNVFDPPSGSDGTGVKRQDPTISTPIALRVQGVATAIAFRSPAGNYPLKDLEPADPLEVIEKKEKKAPRERRRRGGSGMEEMDYGGSDGGEMDYGMDMMEMDMGMMDPMGTAGMEGANGPVRKLDPKGDFGLRPVATKNIQTLEDQPPIPGVAHFIAGTAVVPYKEIHDSYKMAFSTASGFEPLRRDRPLFRGYELQRADVTEKSVDQLVEADWVKRDGNTEVIRRAFFFWSGFAPELVSEEYRIDNFLTMWVPPVLLNDYSKFALHPLIPMKTTAQLAEEERQRALADRPKVIDPTQVEFLDPDDPTVGQAGMGYDGGGGMEDMGMDGMDYGGDMGYGGGMSYGGMGGAPGMMAEANPVDYKLIRFYDFAMDAKDPDAPKEGHQYVYRVRVSVEDPNFPKNPALQPKGNSLAPDVYDRYLQLVKIAETTKVREYKRWSEWSTPSEPVSLPSLDKIYVGPVTAAAPKPANTKLGEYEADPPRANAVISHLERSLGAALDFRMTELTEGSVFSAKPETADIIDPITLEVKKLESPVIESSATIVDIDGGYPLTIQEGEDMRVPGMMLIFDSNGGLQVHDEAGDQEMYRIRSFANERGE